MPLRQWYKKKSKPRPQESLENDWRQTVSLSLLSGWTLLSSTSQTWNASEETWASSSTETPSPLSLSWCWTTSRKCTSGYTMRSAWSHALLRLCFNEELFSRRLFLTLQESEMETEEEVDILMSSDIYSATLSTKSITFSRAQSGWLFREDKTVSHGGKF